MVHFEELFDDKTGRIVFVPTHCRAKKNTIYKSRVFIKTQCVPYLDGAGFQNLGIPPS